MDESAEVTVRDWFGACLRQNRRDEEAHAEEALAVDCARLGELDLAAFQQRAVRRGLRIVRTYGGVLLADAVGLGKTRVGLAMAAALQRDARVQATGGRAG